MAFVFGMVPLVLLVVEVFQDARYSTVVFILLWCFMRAQNCSNFRPGGRKSFCKLYFIMQHPELSLLFLSCELVDPRLLLTMLVSHHIVVLGIAPWGFSHSILMGRRTFTFFCVKIFESAFRSSLIFL